MGLDLDPLLALDGSERAAARERLALPTQDVVFCFVGRFARIKRLDVLLDAVAAARGGGARVHLALVGTARRGPSWRYARSASDWPARSAFSGTGATFRSSTRRPTPPSSPRTTRAPPVSLIEAAAAGLPAVATEVGGVASVVTPRSGLLVAPGDSRALGEAITAIASEAVKREEMGRAAREHVRARFSAERLVDDVDSLYRELLA